ncbi:hypothetical protein WR25_03103 [Diploscapter pachys]|uniref:Cyclin N-terminal domain-containing protein n=1 Tax=Diploscapter pachys TaxID=2018661 RepID=A0A2A2L609_9BILA|nr:hypothetical protein WR25_03103 [Diploscapter pachys]
MSVRADEILTLLASEIKFESTGPDIPDDPDEHFQRSLQLHDQGDSDRARDRKTRWIYTKEELLMNSPSILQGMSPEEELLHRSKAVSFMISVHGSLNEIAAEERLKISKMALNIGIIFLQRFYTIHSFKDLDGRDVATTCLFTAAKGEECPRNLSHFARAYFVIRFKEKHMPNEYIDKMKARIALLEELLIQTLGFDFVVDTPHKELWKIFEDLQLHTKESTHVDIRHKAKFFLQDAIFWTDWIMRYPTKTIAIAVAHITTQYCQYNIPSMQRLKSAPEEGQLSQDSADELPEWYAKYDSKIRHKELKDMGAELLQLYAIESHAVRLKSHLSKLPAVVGNMPNDVPKSSKGSSLVTTPSSTSSGEQQSQFLSAVRPNRTSNSFNFTSAILTSTPNSSLNTSVNSTFSSVSHSSHASHNSSPHLHFTHSSRNYSGRFSDSGYRTESHDYPSGNYSNQGYQRSYNSNYSHHHHSYTHNHNPSYRGRAYRTDIRGFNRNRHYNNSPYTRNNPY